MERYSVLIIAAQNGAEIIGKLSRLNLDFCGLQSDEWC